MKLYQMPQSGNSRKAIWLIGYLGIPAEMQLVNLMTGDHRTPEYLAINPNGKVPALVDGDMMLWESNAILVYLASLHPEAGLIPDAPKAKAEVFRWMFWEANALSPAISKVLMEAVFKSFYGGGDPDPAVVARLTQELHSTCELLDKHLAGKEFVCGKLSVADFALAAPLQYAPMISFDIGKHPNIAAWYERASHIKGWVTF